MSKNRVELFYANWCPHCVHFKPEWQQIKQTLQKNGITCADYEETANPAVMEANNISGYPTVLVDGKEVGASAREIYGAVGIQAGGAGCGDDELMNEKCGMPETEDQFGGNYSFGLPEALVSSEDYVMSDDFVQEGGDYDFGLPEALVSSEDYVMSDDFVQEGGDLDLGLPEALVSTEDDADMLSDLDYQEGGNVTTDFKAKYYKYKAKYFQLLSKKQ